MTNDPRKAAALAEMATANSDYETATDDMAAAARDMDATAHEAAKARVDAAVFAYKAAAARVDALAADVAAHKPTTRPNVTPTTEIFARQIEGGAWVYADRQEHAFSVVAMFKGFDLPAFDTFLEELAADPKAQPAFDSLCAQRADALAAYRAREMGECRAWLNSLQNAWQALRRDEVLHPLAIQGKKFGDAQSAKARRPRGQAVVEGGFGHKPETITQMIERLAARNADHTAKDLWSLFFAELDGLGLDPDEAADAQSIKYRLNEVTDKEKSMTFGRFANIVSGFRKARKSR